MDHKDHVSLLKPGVPSSGGTWADFGSGRGAFTLALAECIGPEGRLLSIDRNGSALEQLKRLVNSRHPNVRVDTLNADFTRPMDLEAIDGLVIANALHFLQEKDKTVRLLSGYLKPGGRFIVVEYNTDKGNHWVPYPFSYPSWQNVAQRNGLLGTKLLATAPSRFLGEFYSAVSYAPGASQTVP
jgi:ubiquinone/menaquinone biosynthesis C-methylase UbiE